MSTLSSFRPVAGSSLFLMWLLFAPLSHAEDPHEDVLVTDPALTLKQVLEQTFSRNPQQYQLQARNSEAQARQASAGSLLPKPAALSFTHQNDALGSGRGEREWQADMEIPLWRAGQRKARTTLAENLQSGIAASKQRLLLEAAGQLREAVWEVQMARKQLELSTLRLQTAEALEKDVERRFKAGELARTDLILAQQETLQARTETIEADAEVNHTHHRYIVLTGLQQIPEQLGEQQSALQSYSDQHPLWVEAESKVGMSEQERALTSVESRENLQLVFNTRSQRGPFDNAYNDSVGLSVRIPLATEAQRAPQIAQAELHVGQAMSERERLRYQLETSMHEADHNLGVSRKALKIATEHHALAAENLRLAEKAFQLGETDLVSLLRSRAQAYQAQNAFNLRAIEVQWNVARYNQAVGVLP